MYVRNRNSICPQEAPMMQAVLHGGYAMVVMHVLRHGRFLAMPLAVIPRPGIMTRIRCVMCAGCSVGDLSRDHKLEVLRRLRSKLQWLMDRLVTKCPGLAAVVAEVQQQQQVCGQYDLSAAV